MSEVVDAYVGHSRTNAILALGERVRASINLQGNDLDVELAVRKLGGTVQYVHNLDPHAQGVIDRLGNKEFRIQLSEDIPEERRKFATAHMLGHVFLDMQYLDGTVWDTQTTYRDSVAYRAGHSSEERDANLFAFSFLMPKEAFTQVAEQNVMRGITNQYLLGPIAKAFGVPIDTAKMRGQNLWLFAL